ncbi:MAG: amidohydrolase family protein [Pseudomonadota bacterium]
MIVRLQFAAFLASLLLASSATAVTWIHAGKLIDGVSDRVQTEKTVIVESGRIVAVRNGYEEPDRGVTLIDLRDYTIMPGLMDMHTHLSTQLRRGSYIDRFIKSEADVALFAASNARRTLEAGFTTVRDLGDAYNATVALKNAINGGALPGPRIFTAAKSLATTGGHADPTNGWRPDLRGNPGPESGVINGPEDAAKAVRQRYKDGADLIKITATGGVLSVARNGQNPQFTEEEVAAIVRTANDYGFMVAAHAHGKEGMQRAIRAGVRSIEHGTFMDDETMRLMRKHNTFYVPTILAGEWVGEKAQIDGYFPEIVRVKAAQIGPIIKQTFARAYDAEVRIVFGTDSGVSPHGDNAREFELMVEAGMPPMTAIQSATSVAAEFLELDNLGRIEPDFLADIIAVHGDPLDDIGVMRKVRFVMKGGVIHKRPN